MGRRFPRGFKNAKKGENVVPDFLLDYRPKKALTTTRVSGWAPFCQRFPAPFVLPGRGLGLAAGGWAWARLGR